MPATLIIIDTDIASDCDDAGAIWLANVAADRGDASLLAFTVSSTAAQSVGATDSINYRFGRSVSIGQNKGTSQSTSSAFAASLFYTYNNGILSASPSTSNATTVLRTALSAAANSSITMVAIGGLTNYNALLNSASDGIDSRNGSALISAKVVKFVVMGGTYPSGTAEFNFALDPAAASNFATNCPVRIDFVGSEVGGTVLTGSGLPSMSQWDPHRRAYQLWLAANGGGTTRPSWDPLATYYAIYGAGSNFGTIQGTNVVNASSGNNTFTAGTGTHFYATKSVSDATLSSIIDGYLNTEPASGQTTAYALSSASRVDWCKFDEGSGTTSTDSTSKGHTVSLLNSAGWLTPGKVGASALDTSTGSTAYGTAADATDLRFTSSQDFTACLWVKTPSSSGSFQTVFTKSRASSPWYGVYIKPSNQAFQFGGTAGGLDSASSVPTSTWVHLAIMQRKGWRLIFINGILSGTSPIAAANSNGTGPLEFGAWSNSGTITEHAPIQIDDFQLFNSSDVEQGVINIMSANTYRPQNMLLAFP